MARCPGSPEFAQHLQTIFTSRITCHAAAAANFLLYKSMNSPIVAPMLNQNLALIFCAVFSTCLFAAPAETLTQICTPCHGEAGISSKAHTPHLNGQLADYLEEDIRRIAKGDRVSSIPEHIPQVWSDQEVIAVADFYSASSSPRPSQLTDPALVAKGAVWYKKQCSNCHMDNGRESKHDAPLLAAQNLDYLQAQMRAFVSGKRKFLFLMDDSFLGLSQADLDAVAHFFASQEQFKK
jgi:sulfide dehydrogenase cytochrome subunit